MRNYSKWYLVSLVDDTDISGASIFKIIQILLKKIKFEYLMLHDINGAGNEGKDGLILSMIEKENKCIKLEEFLNTFNDVKQFQWGDFFMFKEKPIKFQISEGITIYPPLIAQTDTTIRAVDATYIYIYTPYYELIEVIKENYEIESIKYDLLENLDFPY